MDVARREDVRRAMATRPDGIIHLAAISRVVWGEAQPDLCHLVNVGGTLNVLEHALQAGSRPWVIHASSREVYGQALSFPVTEDDPIRPVNHYARSKAAAEYACQAYQAAGLNVAVVRFSSVYGDVLDHEDRVVPAFCRAAVEGKPLRVDGMDTVVDLTHARDVADAVCRIAFLLQHEGRGYPVMHLTSGQGTRLTTLAQMVADAAGGTQEITLAPPREYDVSQFYGATYRAFAMIGWKPSTPLDLGIKRLVDDFRAARETGDSIHT